MAETAFHRRRSRKLFGNNDINNTPPPPPQDPLEVPLPPLPPDVINDLPTYTPPPPKQDSQQSLILTIALPIFFASVFLSCFLRLLSLRDRRRSRRAAAAEQARQPPQEEGGEVYSGLMVDHPIWYIRTVGLHSSVINAIAVCKYNEVEALVGRRAECAVCLNVFQDDDTVRVLPKCNHAFHVACIDTWLKSHKNCPVCRAIIELVDVKFPGGGSPQAARNQPETPTGTPDNNHREQRPDTEDNLEPRNNNIVKDENEGE